jgi:hypothetical protein
MPTPKAEGIDWALHLRYWGVLAQKGASYLGKAGTGWVWNSTTRDVAAGPTNGWRGRLGLKRARDLEAARWLAATRGTIDRWFAEIGASTVEGQHRLLCWS